MEIKDLREQLSRPDGLSVLMQRWRANMPSDMTSLLDRLQSLGRATKPLSRDEAKRLREHLQAHPEITALLNLPDHEAPRIAELKTYARWLHVFESDWPRDENGAAEPIVETGDGRFIPQLQADIEANREQQAALPEQPAPVQEPSPPATNDQKTAKLELDQLPFAQPDLWAAYHDATHPGHSGAVAAVTALHQRVAEGAPQDTAEQTPEPTREFG